MAQGGRIRRASAWTLAAVVAFGALEAPSIAADAAAWATRINDVYRGADRMLPDGQRVEKVLFPALASMDAPPPELATPLRAALVAPGDPLWDAASNWAQASAQHAALEALRSVGESGKLMALLLLYGADEVPPEWKSAGLYVDLGTPPLLAAAQFKYLDALDRLALLVHVEATRLSEDGKPADALRVLGDFVVLGRLMADREFRAEMRWGLDAMSRGLERIRDVAWVYRESLTDSDIKAVIDRLDPATHQFGRIRLPRADRMAAEQIVEETFVARQGPDPEKFGPTMARLSAKDRPLMLFGESARWQTAAATHGSTFDTADAVAEVAGGWEYRWDLPQFDKLLESPSDFERLDKSKFKMVETILGPMGELFDLRQKLHAEAAATRMGLGVLAFERRTKKFPGELTLIRPVYVKDIESDPWSRDQNPFAYFVPIRDQPREERALPEPHVIGVALNAAPAEPVDPALVAETKALLEATFSDRVETFKSALGLNKGGMNEEGLARLDEIIGDDTLSFGTAKDKEQLARVAEGLRLRAVNVEALNQRAALEISDALRDRISKAKNNREVQDIFREVTPDAVLTDLLKRGDQLVLEALQRDVGVFPVELDDSYFVLYSAGIDQEADWAISVGEAAPDILYWPSMLTVLRASLEERSVELGSIAAAWDDFDPLKAPPKAKYDPSQAENSPSAKPSGGPPRRIN